MLPPFVLSDQTFFTKQSWWFSQTKGDLTRAGGNSKFLDATKTSREIQSFNTNKTNIYWSQVEWFFYDGPMKNCHELMQTSILQDT